MTCEDSVRYCAHSQKPLKRSSALCPVSDSVKNDLDV